MEDNTMMQDVNVENVMDSINEVTDLVPTTDDDLNVVENDGLTVKTIVFMGVTILLAADGLWHIGKFTFKKLKDAFKWVAAHVGNPFKKKTEDETETIETVEAEVVENETK